MKNFPFWKRLLGFALFALAVLLTLLILTVSVISFQGRRDWDRTKAGLLARGEILNLAPFIPPAIPDETNFFSDPLWTAVASSAPLESQKVRVLKAKPSISQKEALKKLLPSLSDADLGYETSAVLFRAWTKAATPAQRDALALFTLQTLDPSTDTLDHIVLLLQRPAARFSTDYEKVYTPHYPHVPGLLSLGQAFALRALAEIQLGQSQSALRDLDALLGLSRTVQEEPFIYSFLVRKALLSMVFSPLAEGITAHLWSASDLDTIARALESENLLPALSRSFRAERAGFNSYLETIANYSATFKSVQQAQAYWISRVYFATFGPADQAYANRWYQTWLDALDHAPPGTLKSSFAKDPALDSPLFRYTHFYTALTLPVLGVALASVAHVQDGLTEACTACALERYYLARGEYPARLEDLLTTYLTVLPLETLTHQALSYQRTPPGSFRLWSTAWDKKNDQGRPAFKPTEEGDWTWGAVPR